MILSDKEIRSRCIDEYVWENKDRAEELFSTIISPYVPHKVRREVIGYDELENKPISKEVISYGQSSGGYDIRLGTNFKVYRGEGPIDPKNIDEMEWQSIEREEPLILDPFECILGESLEIFNMPDDVIGLALGKSTYARSNVFCNVTPLEPNWRGVLTIEISNMSKHPVYVYPKEGIIQILFFQFSDSVENGYTGWYQDQKGVTTSKIGEIK